MKLYFSAFIILLAVLLAHILGINGLYFQYDSYDIFMHILGGIGVGLFLAAFIKSNFKTFSQASHIRRNIIIGVFIVGIIWELFEMYFNIAGAPVGTKAYYIDTVKDLFDDCVGGAVVAWMCFKRN